MTSTVSNPPSPPIYSRRTLLSRAAFGLGTAALWKTLQGDAAQAASPNGHFPARAKNVIFIFMSGGPSHLDLYDPKPLMTSLHGQPVPESLLAFAGRSDHQD